jgi:3-hydroxyisobutyrate dehydrogenase-like beta-hydroxyacid dehydrogenase
MTALGRVGFIGCGAMGGPMAERLIDAGAEVRVCDPSPAATAPLLALGARLAWSPREAASGAAVAFASLPSPEISVEVALGAEGVAGTPGLATYVEMSTIGSAPVQRIARELARFGIGVLDAPVSGGPRGARGRCRRWLRETRRCWRGRGRCSMRLRAMCSTSAPSRGSGR